MGGSAIFQHGQNFLPVIGRVRQIIDSAAVIHTAMDNHFVQGNVGIHQDVIVIVQRQIGDVLCHTPGIVIGPVDHQLLAGVRHGIQHSANHIQGILPVDLFGALLVGIKGAAQIP